LRDRLRSGDVWVERSVNYRRFDSYLLPPAEVPSIAAKLGLSATADEWLAKRGAELDRRLRRFSRRLRRGELEGGHCQVNQGVDVCGQSDGDSELSYCLTDAGLLSPSPERLRASASIAGCGHEMASRPKVAIDHRMRRQEPLCLVG